MSQGENVVLTVTLRADGTSSVAAADSVLAKLGTTTQQTAQKMGPAAQITHTLTEGFRDLAGEVPGVGTALSGMLGPLGAVVAATATVAALFASLKTSIDIGRQTQGFIEQFTAFTGSVTNARMELERIEHLSETADFSIPSLAEADQQMLLFGLDAKRLLPDVADAADKLGVSVTEVTNALAMTTLGMTRGLKRFGIDIGEIQRETGVQIVEGSKLTRDQMKLVVDQIVEDWTHNLAPVPQTIDDQMTHIESRIHLMRQRLFDMGVGTVIETTLNFTIHVLDATQGALNKLFAVVKAASIVSRDVVKTGETISFAILQSIPGVDFHHGSGKLPDDWNVYGEAIGPKLGPPPKKHIPTKEEIAAAKAAQQWADYKAKVLFGAYIDFRQMQEAGGGRESYTDLYGDLSREYSDKGNLPQSLESLSVHNTRVEERRAREIAHTKQLGDLTRQFMGVGEDANLGAAGAIGAGQKAQYTLDQEQHQQYLDEKQAAEERYIQAVIKAHGALGAAMAGFATGAYRKMTHELENYFLKHKTVHNLLGAVVKAGAREAEAASLEYISKRAAHEAKLYAAEALAEAWTNPGKAAGDLAAAAALGVVAAATGAGASAIRTREQQQENLNDDTIYGRNRNQNGILTTDSSTGSAANRSLGLQGGAGNLTQNFTLNIINQGTQIYGQDAPREVWDMVYPFAKQAFVTRQLPAA